MRSIWSRWIGTDKCWNIKWVRSVGIGKEEFCKYKGTMVLNETCNLPLTSCKHEKYLVSMNRDRRVLKSEASKQASIPYGTSALPWILARLMPICDAMCTNRFWVQIALTVFISRWDSLEIYEVFHGDWNIDGLIDRFRVILEVCGSIWIAFDVHWSCAGASWDRRCGDEIAGWRSLEPWTWHRAHLHSRPHGGT